MATVTGLTADRMLAIEAASVVDGDVVGNDLILTQHGGTQINAGNVRGPAGPTGPVGQDLVIASALPVLDVGLVGQIRAGRQLTAADFTNMGLSAPRGLWNLSDLTDASGNGRNLLNKGAVTFGPGVNGLAATAANFSGQNGQALYIPDSGVADSLRIKTGSWGGWMRQSSQNATSMLLYKSNTEGTLASYGLLIDSGSGRAGARVSLDGTLTSPGFGMMNGTSFVCDNRWHFLVVTYDNAVIKMYVDGILESQVFLNGPIFSSSAPFNIGNMAADAATNGPYPAFGSVDEVFVTADVLSEDQIRNLYCVKLPHTLVAIPSRVSLNVRRRRKGATLVVADFSAQPLRLYNFSAGSLGDEGSNGVALTNNGAASSASGADGTSGNAFSFSGVQNFSATDAGLPSGLSSRSYGCWFKTSRKAVGTMVAYGSTVGAPVILVDQDGKLTSINWGTDQIAGQYVADGQWHHAVAVEDNSLGNGKRKLYCDGRLTAVSNLMAATTLGGPTAFHIGANFDGSWGYVGQVDSAFVTGYAMTADEIRKLYAKGTQTLPPSPKNVGDHVEALTATDILATFDSLESQHLIDLTVAP